MIPFTPINSSDQENIQINLEIEANQNIKLEKRFLLKIESLLVSLLLHSKYLVNTEQYEEAQTLLERIIHHPVFDKYPSNMEQAQNHPGFIQLESILSHPLLRFPLLYLKNIALKMLANILSSSNSPSSMVVHHLVTVLFISSIFAWKFPPFPLVDFSYS